MAPRRPALAGAGRLQLTRGRRLGDQPVDIRTAVAEKMPEVAGVFDQRAVEVRVDDLVALVASPREYLAARADEDRAAEVGAVRGAANVGADLVDAADVVVIGNRVGPQLDLPDLADPGTVGGSGHDDEIG